MFSVLALHSCDKTVKSRREKTEFSPYIGPSESAVEGPLRGPCGRSNARTLWRSQRDDYKGTRFGPNCPLHPSTRRAPFGWSYRYRTSK
jgi:hypothetical protein